MADLVEVALPTDPLELEESPRVSVPHQVSEGQVDRIAGRPDPVDPLHPLDELLVHDDVRPLHTNSIHLDTRLYTYRGSRIRGRNPATFPRWRATNR